MACWARRGGEQGLIVTLSCEQTEEEQQGARERGLRRGMVSRTLKASCHSSSSPISPSHTARS